MILKKSRSLLSVQILATFICLFSIIYLILSSFTHLSFDNIISETWIQSKPIQIISQQEFKPKPQNNSRSFICDRQGQNDGTRVINITSSIDDHLMNILRRK